MKQEWEQQFMMLRQAIDVLEKGTSVKVRPKGNSMSGRIDSGQLVTLIPVTKEVLLEKNDIVLCKVKGNIFLHLIKAIHDGQYLIGNNKGGTNGWTKQVYGVVTKVE